MFFFNFFLIFNPGFEWVCRQKGWNAADTWRELNGDSIWFKASTQVRSHFYNGPSGCLLINNTCRRTFTGTSLTACGGSMSQVETESTSPRRPPGPLHRLAGRPLDHLDRCQVWSPPSETFKSWRRRKSFVKNGPTPYLMAALRNLYKVISRQLDSALALSCYSQNQWLPELLTAEVLTLKCCICILATRLT